MSTELITSILKPAKLSKQIFKNITISFLPEFSSLAIRIKNYTLNTKNAAIQSSKKITTKAL